ncbi:hypothetical protein [Streptomyces sp. JJ36]|uniref:hypothetical protein n=1 Tax=Streptomyces sp. JJ36 TaxID=2736645 RepID=UPI001F45CD6C|nr:hypothetical protein [Streptomyces sp. JJ36]MCF6523089.1 hypothetical protein [Streptomyces sp. JJ36]
MFHTIVRIGAALLHRLCPATGRHRAGLPAEGRQAGAPSVVGEAGEAAAPPVRRRGVERRPVAVLLPLTDLEPPLIRPYLLTPEERAERRAHRERWRALLPPARGYADAPGFPYGAEEAAR